jgi:hypothetical protein
MMQNKLENWMIIGLNLNILNNPTIWIDTFVKN